MLKSEFGDVRVEVATTRNGALAAFAASIPAHEWAAYRDRLLADEDPMAEDLPADHLTMDPQDLLLVYVGKPTDEGDDTVWGEGDNYVLVGPREPAATTATVRVVRTADELG